MATLTDFNVSPYYDDYTDTNNYHRILFRPSYAVQARELTQAQTILQNQIERFGNNIFKEGAMVVPGNISIHTEYEAVKLTSFSGTSSLSNLVGGTFTGATSGVQAVVIDTVVTDGTDPDTLFVKYTNSGSNNATTTFAAENIAATISIAGVSTSITCAVASTATGSAAQVEAGIFFTRGFFVQNDAQKIILDKYTNEPSYRIGLNVGEVTNTSTEDGNLNDNAAGSSNENAPGAHRLKITLTLAKLALTSTLDNNFIELARIVNGIIVKQVRATAFNVIEDTLARRTHDESGDYTVREFSLDLRESVASGTNRGIYTAGATTDKGNVSSTAMLAGLLSPGKAYVKGYEIDRIAQDIVDIDKARDFTTVNNNVTQFDLGNFMYVDNVHSLPDMGVVTGSNASDVSPYRTVSLMDFATSTPGAKVTTPDSEIGRAKIRGFEHAAGTASSKIFAQTSVFKAYLFDVEMFTTIEVDGVISNSSGFTTGEKVTGGTSGATGIVESVSTEKSAAITGASTATPVVVTMSGGHSFKEGQVVKIAGVGGITDINGNFTVKNPTGTTFEVFSDASSGGTPTAVGSSQTFSGSSGTVKHDTVQLTNIQGQFTENEVITGAISTYTATIQYSAFGRKGVTQHTIASVKQLYSNTANEDFTADAALSSAYGSRLAITGNITIANSASVISGSGTKFTTELVIGDRVSFITNAGTALTRTIESITSDTSLNFDTAVGSSDVSTAKVATRDRAKVNEANKNTAIFQLPYSPIKTLLTTSNSLQTDTSYTVRRTFIGNLSSGSISLSAGSGETFLAAADVDYTLSLETAPGTGSVGDLIQLTSNELSGTGSGTLTIALGSGFGSAKVKVNTSISRSTAGQKNKTDNTAQTVQIATQALCQGDFVSIGKADVHTLTSVKMAADFSTNATASDTDVTDRFTLDTGQRDNFYDIGRLIKKQNAITITGRLLITYSFYSHGSGEYFSVDSYPSAQYETIPEYVSDTTGQTFKLRDCLDFRPRVDDASTIDAGGNNREFDGTGAAAIDVPKFNGLITSDLEHYLDRIDKIFLSKDGEFKTLKGTSSVYPTVPKDIDDALHLYTLDIPAYTFNPSDINILPQDNRRYTMRDIGGLERRIENVEYYTQLSLLETAAENLQIQDADGFDRFKNGFIVDNFTGHDIGDTTNSDYNIAMDMAAGEARPTHFTDAVKLVEADSTGSTTALNDTTRSVSNYQKTGDFITLPYTEVSEISQPFATQTENINPFDVVKFIGGIALSPSRDEWKEVERAPELVVQGADNFATIVASNGGALSTVWNEWQDSWTGAPRTTSSSTNRRSGRVITTTRRSTTTRQVGQTRTGIRTRIVPRTVRRSAGDRTINVAFVPFIRSRVITFTGTEMRPSTRVYPFFDNVAVTDYCTPNGGSLGGSLITDANGAVTGTFSIPDPKNNSNPRWRTGDRVFKLTSSSTGSNVSSEIATAAFANYNASGIIETKQQLIISTREGITQRETVNQNQTTTRTNSSSSITTQQVGGGGNGGGGQGNGGQGGKDPLAQTFRVENDGGLFVTSIDIFFGKKSTNIPVTCQIRTVVNGYPSEEVLPFGQKVLNPSSVSVSETGTAATNFLFPSPVYLRDGTEYCMVLLANTTDYTAFVATTGEKALLSGRLVSKQPSLGVMFKSQNGSTWSASQMQDLKFDLKRAKFDISSTGTATLVNDAVATRPLITNPFKTTSGSAVVRVSHPNHGMHSTSANVTISGVGSTINNIAASAFNKTHTSISNITLDSYDITVASNANLTGNAGGSTVVATQDRHLDQCQLFIPTMELPGTTITTKLRTTTGKSVDGSESSYSLTASTNANPASIGENILFNGPQTIASSINETNEMSGNKSFITTLELSSDRDNITPVIDTESMSVFVTKNRINSPVSGTTPDFVAETNAKETSGAAKYLTKSINLDSPSTALDIRISANIQNESAMRVFFRATGPSETRRLQDIAFTPFNTTGVEDILVTQAEDDFTFNEYKFSASDIEEFTSFQIKIVLTGTNSAIVPRIKDLRGIALAV